MDNYQDFQLIHKDIIISYYS